MTTETQDAITWMGANYEPGWEDHLWRLVPEHMHEGISAYAAFGWPIGDFLTAVLENRLVEAFGRADEKNKAAMAGWAEFIYNHAPSPCWGSPEKVRAWQEAGGLRGREHAEVKA